MKWIEIKIVFDPEDQPLAVDLISNIFHDCGVQGIVIEDPGDEPSEDWGKDAVKYEHHAVIGYFQEDDDFNNRFQVLKEQLNRFEKEHGILCQMVYTEIDEADWAESWKDYFWPQKHGDRIVVKPVWREYAEKEDEIVVEIDPGMAFGTGTHPTTGLCLTLIDKYIKRGDLFLDVGTGSGILMVAAAKLGARKVWGTDSDEISTDVARENLMLNRIPATDIEVRQGHLAEKVTDRFDVVAANLSKKAVLALMDDAHRILKDDGVLICSGMIEADMDTVVEKMLHLNFDIIETLLKDHWVAIVCRFKQSENVS